jgi:hypothetical protein
MIFMYFLFFIFFISFSPGSIFSGGCETICGFECDFPKLDHTGFFPLIC